MCERYILAKKMDFQKIEKLKEWISEQKDLEYIRETSEGLDIIEGDEPEPRQMIRGINLKKILNMIEFLELHGFVHLTIDGTLAFYVYWG